MFQYLENGVIYRKASDWRGGLRLRPNEMYVCPNSGILKTVRLRKSGGETTSPICSSSMKLLRKKDTWWELKFQRYPDEPELQYDVWLDRPLSRLTVEKCKFVYGENAFAISKRQLTNRQFRQRKRELDKDRANQLRRQSSK